MITSRHRKRLRALVLALGLLFGTALACQGDPGCAPWTPTCLEDLEGLSECQLRELFVNAGVGHPLDGVARGKLIYLTDRRLNRFKLRMSAAVWRGKAGCAETGYFTNRWIGNVNWIDSTYVIGPSWIDGKPAVIIEYPPKTPLFANMHDELREIAPGLYLGPVIERFPCPHFRGYLALQMECCKPAKPCRCRR